MEWLRYNEIYGHLQRILIKVDRMSMANSLEVRVPFVDEAVMEQAMNFYPNEFKTKDDLKKVLKIMMCNYYPEDIIYKHKKGFSVPIEQWLKHQLKDDVKRVIFDMPFYGAHLINLEKIKDYVNQFYNDNKETHWGIWHIYAWQKWAISQGLI